MEEAKNFPTMIIPNGTDVSVNEHGQLSIRTPGNLVIQNSGVYSVIESGSGSVRIDPDVKVLLSSGFSIDGEATKILARGCDGFIQKPFTMKDLSERIRQVVQE
ncbi:MAG: hypothetical protein OQK55_10270 [Thermoanaerobaculales bacterium]|nr:hypothetical protein [Thermoanaerobaculales bacterium]